MKSRINKKNILIFTLCLVINLCFVSTVLADDPTPSIGGSDAMINGVAVTATSADIAGTPHDLNLIAGGIVNYSFGVLGIVFITVIMIGGYFLMASGGAEENIAKAKAFIINGISGLIVIMVVYALVYTIMFSLNKSIGG